MTIEDYLEAGLLEPSSDRSEQRNSRGETPWCKAFRIGNFEEAYRQVVSFEENGRLLMDGEDDLAEYDEVWSPQGVRLLQLRGRTLPAWNRERVKNVCVWHLQGYGDAFWLGRYLPAMLERAETVSVIVPMSMYKLFKENMPSGVEVFDRLDGSGALKRADAWAGSTTLPYLSGQGYGKAAWIKSNRHKRTHDKPRIGVIWAGSASNIFNGLRSIPVSGLGRLFAMPGIEWHSLQVGDKAGECPEGVINHEDEIGDWNDTVQIIETLDLVISVDTGCANLVGAMGLPLWVLVEQRSDFRWGNSGELTPWFPSARVFRQGKDHKWKPVIRRVASALAEWRDCYSNGM